MEEKKQKTEVHGVMNRMRQQTHIVLWLLVFAFVGTIIFDWGMDLVGMKSPVQKGVLGKVNGQEITYQAFFQQMQNEYVRYQQQNGSAPEEPYMRQVREQLWNNAVNEILVNEVVNKYDLTATDQEIIQEIRYNPIQELRNAPDFQLPEGGFDQAKYEAFLASDQTGTVVFLENQARANIPYRKLQQLVVSAVRVTDAEVRQRFIINESKMDVDFIIAGSDRFADAEITITDNEIADYYKDHKNEFFVSETRELRYVLFDTTPTKEDSAALESDVAEALQRAKAGEDFTALAQEYTDSDGFFGTVGKGFVSDEYEEALFNKRNKKGDVIGPVITDVGKSIFKIERIVKRRSEIDSVEAKHIMFQYEPSENTLDVAESKASYFSQTAVESGLDNAAEQDDLEIYEMMPINRTGFIPGFGSNEEIFSFAFQSEFDEDKKPISQAIETPSGFAVFELVKINESHTKDRAEVRDEIFDILRQEKQIDLAFDLMKSVKEDIDAGTSFEDAAEKYNLEIKNAEAFSFYEYVSEIGRDIKFAATAIGLEKGEISRAVKGSLGSYILRTTEKNDFDEEKYKQQIPQIANQMLMEKRRLAYNDWLAALRKKADIEDFRDQFFR